MRIEIIPHHRHKYVTSIGYWYWTGENNTGELVIQCSRMDRRRFEWAVIGHELIEALYCWLFGITTEHCDAFDDWMDEEYDSGRIPLEFEGGCHKDCPYHWGHMLGMAWEYVCIYGTFASWRNYLKDCNRLLGIKEYPE